MTQHRYSPTKSFLSLQLLNRCIDQSMPRLKVYSYVQCTSWTSTPLCSLLTPVHLHAQYHSSSWQSLAKQSHLRPMLPPKMATSNALPLRCLLQAEAAAARGYRYPPIRAPPIACQVYKHSVQPVWLSKLLRLAQWRMGRQQLRGNLAAGRTSPFLSTGPGFQLPAPQP